MLGWACSFEHLKRRSMARPRRASQFHIGEPFQSRRRAEILAGRFREGRLQTVAHHRQIQIEEFLFQGYHRIPFPD
jgi:hypothetical protein